MNILGIDIDDYPSDLSQVLEFVMMVKGLDDEGKVTYFLIGSPTLHAVEAVGMLRWGELTLSYEEFAGDEI